MGIRDREQAVQQIQSCLDGNPDARLDCDREGELYRLFHSVNALTAVLSAHAANEQREKRFLKNTIADISHQLKTPLAALNIYNGLLQAEAVSPSEVKDFADRSEQELDLSLIHIFGATGGIRTSGLPGRRTTTGRYRLALKREFC